MDCDEPCACNIDEVVKLVGESDTVNRGIHGEEEEEDIRHMTKTEQQISKNGATK